MERRALRTAGVDANCGYFLSMVRCVLGTPSALAYESVSPVPAVATREALGFGILGITRVGRDLC